MAIDESPASHAAFNLAIRRVHSSDVLIILTVGRRYTTAVYTTALTAGQASEDSRCKKLLREYASAAKAKGIHYRLVFTHAEQGLDVGEALTNYLSTHPSHEIYLGRRHLRYGC